MMNNLDYIVWIFLQLILCETSDKVSTACYGSPGIGCTEHKLICTESLVISITNITFGYRRGCSHIGISSCVNIRCCTEEAGDCFTPYNQTLLSQLQQTCSGGSTCTLNSYQLRERSSRCFKATSHTYSKIEYQCVVNKLPIPAAGHTTTGLGLATDKERGTDTDVGSIVGGIVGVILIIAIVCAVIFFVKRRLTKLKSQNEHQYDSAPSRITDQSTPVHNSVNTRPQADKRTQVSATTNGQTQANYVTHDYEHAYDSAPSVVTDEPKPVYDSLNTREQTGYYNMGSMNTTDDNQLSTTNNGCKPMDIHQTGYCNMGNTTDGSQHSTTNNGRSPINTNNLDYEHAYSALDHDTNKPKTVYDSLNTREQTGYCNMGSINTTDDSQQPGITNGKTQIRT